MSDSLLESVRSLSEGLNLDYSNAYCVSGTSNNFSYRSTSIDVGSLFVVTIRNPSGASTQGFDVFASSDNSSWGSNYIMRTSYSSCAILGIMYLKGKRLYDCFVTNYTGAVQEYKKDESTDYDINYLFFPASLQPNSSGAYSANYIIPPPKWTYLLILCTPFDFNARKCA